MTITREKIPQNAMHLKESIKGNIVFNENSKVEQLRMTAYSGGVIKGHWFLPFNPKYSGTGGNYDMLKTRIID